MIIRTWSLTLQNIPFLMKFLQELDFDKRWEIVIKEKETDRTLEQNSRLWKLYTSIGNYTGYTKDEVHNLMRYKFLREQKTVNGETYEVILSTTSLKTKQMAHYQEQIEIWATQIGWSWDE